jgi:enoyl-CoA hydratase/carnithine racemase
LTIEHIGTPDSAGEALVLFEHLGGDVSRITLNRPAQRNAMNRAARSALVDALDECRVRRAKVVILTGAGPAFCAGVDLKEAAPEASESATDDAAQRRSAWSAVQEAIRRHPAVVIAAVNGYALGGGLTLINTSDLAVAAEDAQIGMPEVSFGLYPGLAGPSTQLRLSAKRAAWMVLSAERIDGRTAESWGLVNRAVPGGELAATALAMARTVAQYDAVTLEWSKKALWEIPMHLTDWTTALEYGENVRAQIRVRTNAFDQGLENFAQGQRSSAQGSAGHNPSGAGTNGPDLDDQDGAGPAPTADKGPNASEGPTGGA